jgi:hypothetical protein
MSDQNPEHRVPDGRQKSISIPENPNVGFGCLVDPGSPKLHFNGMLKVEMQQPGTVMTLSLMVRKNVVFYN